MSNCWTEDPVGVEAPLPRRYRRPPRGETGLARWWHGANWLVVNWACCTWFFLLFVRRPVFPSYHLILLWFSTDVRLRWSATLCSLIRLLSIGSNLLLSFFTPPHIGVVFTQNFIFPAPDFPSPLSFLRLSFHLFLLLCCFLPTFFPLSSTFWGCSYAVLAHLPTFSLFFPSSGILIFQRLCWLSFSKWTKQMLQLRIWSAYLKIFYNILYGRRKQRHGRRGVIKRS